MKKLSVIIVTYNSLGDIFDCLDSVFRFSDIPEDELEVIVVENNSPQGDEMIAGITNKYGNNVVSVRNDRNGGYGQGNNVGIRLAQAPVILVMNPDVRLVEPVFGDALKAFDNPGTCMYGIKQYRSYANKSHNSILFSFRVNGYIRALLMPLFNRLNLYFARFMYFSGSFFFVRKEMLASVGLFDESVFMYGEEEDIHYRLTKRFGAHHIYNPQRRYVHLSDAHKETLKYSIAMLDSLIAVNVKNGICKRRILSNYLRITNVKLVREWVRVKSGQPREMMDMLIQFRNHILSKIKEDKTA